MAAKPYVSKTISITLFTEEKSAVKALAETMINQLEAQTVTDSNEYKGL